MMKKKDINSISYAAVFSMACVLIIVVVLFVAHLLLQPRQHSNVELDMKRQILAALNINNVKDVEGNYNKYVKKDMILRLDGLGFNENPPDNFATDYNSEFSRKQFHVFSCTVNGQTKYVFPLIGKGLYGPIWGFISLNNDRNTVFGTSFSHSNETPGIGAKIASSDFQRSFHGKRIVVNGSLQLCVVKKGEVRHALYEVDDITDGTITSKEVNDMIRQSLSNYMIFFLNK
jgi:Na+-transporting NADH:ubiquinone oxidoreductase subunit C